MMLNVDVLKFDYNLNLLCCRFNHVVLVCLQLSIIHCTTDAYTTDTYITSGLILVLVLVLVGPVLVNITVITSPSTRLRCFLFSVQKFRLYGHTTAEIAQKMRMKCERNGHSRSLKVVRCCASRRGIYDFLLALNSNLTSVFNHSYDITPSLHFSIPHLSGGTGKRRLGLGGHAFLPGCPEHWTIQT